jgi:replicative superfamily II helicase
MKTSGYKWYRPPFPNFNAAQESAVPFLDTDTNLVISFATAAGKTVLAECCFGYHLLSDDKCVVAYVAPFRSLAWEKWTAWGNEPQLSRHGISLWSGDDKIENMDGRIVISTLESFDVRMRKSKWEDWIKRMACVVMDEAHIIGTDGRGGAMEASMMRLTKRNPSTRVIVLSATMSNAMDIAKWVKGLNGKNTKCITSSWRPVSVKTQYHGVADSGERDGKAIELVGLSGGRKTLVFVHSKITGRDITKRIRDTGRRAVFHNASLSPAKRRQIEKAFGDPTSGLNVIVSTSTLGSGVNLE